MLLEGQVSLSGQRASVADPHAWVILLGGTSAWAYAIGRALVVQGLQVATSVDMRGVLDRLARDRVALVVLGADGPDTDSTEWCRAIRSRSSVPIFVLSSHLDHDAAIQAMEAGADDYMGPSFNPDLFVARVRALLRRSEASPTGDELVIRDLRIDPARCEATVKGQQVKLTATEFRLLLCLAQNAGRVLDSQKLVQATRGYFCDEREAQNVVKVHIANIRRKLNVGGEGYPYIHSVRGFGYMLERRTAPRPDDPLLQHIEP
jgi:DNA-binding response OmpR family regulator